MINTVSKAMDIRTHEGIESTPSKRVINAHANSDRFLPLVRKEVGNE